MFEDDQFLELNADRVGWSDCLRKFCVKETLNVGVIDVTALNATKEREDQLDFSLADEVVANALFAADAFFNSNEIVVSQTTL